MEEYWFLARMSSFAISSASLNFFSETLHDSLPVDEKTTSCKKATGLPG